MKNFTEAFHTYISRQAFSAHAKGPLESSHLEVVKIKNRQGNVIKEVELKIYNENFNGFCEMLTDYCLTDTVKKVNRKLRLFAFCKHFWLKALNCLSKRNNI